MNIEINITDAHNVEELAKGFSVAKDLVDEMDDTTIGKLRDVAFYAT